MKKNQSNELEDLFRDSLKDFSVNARAENWSKIDRSLNDLELNDNLKQKFLDHKHVPAAQQKELFIKNLDARSNALFYSKRIAASLCLLIACFFFFNNPTKSSDKIAGFEINFPTDHTNDLAFEFCKDPELLSLDIVKTKVKPIRKKKKRSKKASKTKQLLDIILAEDEGIESSLDSARIAEILKPSAALPFEGMTASTRRFQESDFQQRQEWYPLPEVDFRISIPLQILDDKEIEALLRN